MWDTVLRFLKADLRWTLLIAVLVAFGGWVAGPARYAVWIRKTTVGGARWVGAQAKGLSSGAGRTGRAVAESSRVRRSAGWILEHLNGLRIVGVIVAGLFLVFGGNLTGWSLLIIVIVLAVYVGLLQTGGRLGEEGVRDRPTSGPRLPARARRSSLGDRVQTSSGRGPLSLVPAMSSPHTGLMADIALTVGAAGIFLVGFVAWCARWRRRCPRAASSGSRCARSGRRGGSPRYRPSGQLPQDRCGVT